MLSITDLLFRHHFSSCNPGFKLLVKGKGYTHYSPPLSCLAPFLNSLFVLETEFTPPLGHLSATVASSQLPHNLTPALANG